MQKQKLLVSEIKIQEYHNLKNVYLSKLSNLTIFFGQNNSGKTSFLNWIADNYKDQVNYVAMDEMTFLFADKTVNVSDAVIDLRKKALADLISKFKKSRIQNRIIPQRRGTNNQPVER